MKREAGKDGITNIFQGNITFSEATSSSTPVNVTSKEGNRFSIPATLQSFFLFLSSLFLLSLIFFYLKLIYNYFQISIKQSSEVFGSRSARPSEGPHLQIHQCGQTIAATTSKKVYILFLLSHYLYLPISLPFSPLTFS